MGERFPIGETASATKAPPAREVLADSRTMKGGGAAGVATPGAAPAKVDCVAEGEPQLRTRRPGRNLTGRRCVSKRYQGGLVARISGIISVVQESRFRLSTGDGRSIIFTLAGDATLEPQDLQSLVSGPEVEIIFSAQSGRKAMTAHCIREAGP